MSQRAGGGAEPANVRIHVLAGVNGAGKSSLLGNAILARGGEFFNPDEVTRRMLTEHPDQGLAQANANAWFMGLLMLDGVISFGGEYTFETTLGGDTYTSRLLSVLAGGGEVHMRYVGLDGVELHIERVRARVARAGHDIPEEKIRARYESSRQNLLTLLPLLTSLKLFDNSAAIGPDGRPAPVNLLVMERGRILRHVPLAQVPGWAKGIVMAALKLQAKAPTP